MSDWQAFFDGHAPVYMQNVFTRNTLAEVDFLIEEMKLPAGSRILDIGCGTGRHSVELARRGYRMTGVDLSAGMLAEAAKAAQAAGVDVTWVHADATRFRSHHLFDAAICLCEGAFSLLGMADDPVAHDMAILRNIHAAVKPGAPFILTALNGMRYIRQCTQEDVDKGVFDPLTLTETITAEWETPEGKKSAVVRERGYVPSELRLILRQVGFQVEHIWGGTAGDWGRRPIKLDEIEIMVVARKTP